MGTFESANGLIFTTRQVMCDGWTILTVTHDVEDGAWQFVNGWGDTDDASDGMAVHVEHIIGLDPSILLLTDLPLGWQAWREHPEDEWVREPQKPD